MVDPVAWCTAEDVTGSQAEGAFSSISPEVMTKAIATATAVLFSFTDRRWPGVRQETIRPVVERSCAGLPGRRPFSVIDLARRPIVSVDEVTIDGSLLAAGLSELVDGRYLVRVDGTAWPRIADPVTSGGGIDASRSFTVAYSWGAAPPAAGRVACGVLAWQLALAMTPKATSETKLPRRVTTISRGGQSVTLMDPLTLFDDGKTGLADVDLWVAAVKRSSGNAEVRVPGRRERSRRWA